jgi:hypothetical protein
MLLSQSTPPLHENPALTRFRDIRKVTKQSAFFRFAQPQYPLGCFEVEPLAKK